MKILLDENVPEPLAEPLSWLLVRKHEMTHVNAQWKGIKDRQLYDKAKRKGYDVVISNDSQQLLDPDICRAIQRSGRHVVFIETSSGGYARWRRPLARSSTVSEGSSTSWSRPMVSGSLSCRLYAPSRGTRLSTHDAKPRRRSGHANSMATISPLAANAPVSD
ncbi:DUF5615 family PIN-like protein [Nonomuraea rubra]|uniref:DUF5615 family PIN-like protein n=1 Tax=Nonomuraea rubra TaxID=46180 RepID=UPI00362278BF